MKVGTKVIIEETNQIGVIHSVTPKGNKNTVKVGNKIVVVIGKTVKILTWILEIIAFLKKIKIWP